MRPEAGLGDHELFGGVMPGIVTNNQDPEKLGRVRLHLPWLHEEGDESWWARVVQPMAGGGRGWWILPELEDEVLVAFEHGDIRFPYVLGGLYNGKDTPPSCEIEGHDGNANGKNEARFLRTRSGHKLIFDDGGGGGQPAGLFLRDRSDDTKLELFNPRATTNVFAKRSIIVQARGSIHIKAGQNIKVEAAGRGITLNAVRRSIHLKAARKLEMEAQGPIVAGASSRARLVSPGKIQLQGDRLLQIKMGDVRFENPTGSFAVRTDQVITRFRRRVTVAAGSLSVRARRMCVVVSRRHRVHARGRRGVRMKGALIGVKGRRVWLCPKWWYYL